MRTFGEVRGHAMNECPLTVGADIVVPQVFQIIRLTWVLRVSQNLTTATRR